MRMKLFGLGVITIAMFCSAFTQQPAAPQPTSLPGAESKVYKTIGETKLMLHVFQPADRKAGETRPAIVFSFGGGWRQGTVMQFVEHSKHLAARGMVAIAADYRVKSRHGVTPVECIADAKSAIRWVRSHAKEFGIDPNRIAAGGGSAGGHLAASTATVKEFDEKGEDLKVSSASNALALFNPALDTSKIPADYGFGNKAVVASPVNHIRNGLPPAIIFHGTADSTVPINQAVRFCEEMAKHIIAANWCSTKEGNMGSSISGAAMEATFARRCKSWMSSWFRWDI
ncbi:MAG: alpha/beta hydrolase [Blastocatellia bacterium]